MLGDDLGAVRARAERLAGLVGGEVEETVGRVGGGALPLAELPSFACAVEEELARPLRTSEPPVVGVVRDGRLLLDCRTLGDAEVEEVSAAVAAARRSSRHQPGKTVLVQEVWQDRVWAARPMRVVRDDGDFAVLWFPRGTCWKAPTTPPGLPRGRKIGRAPGHVRAERRVGIPAMPSGTSTRSSSCARATGTRSGSPGSLPGEHLGWYVLQLPFRRTQLGFETMDLVLDLIVDPDGAGAGRTRTSSRRGSRAACASRSWRSGSARKQRASSHERRGRPGGKNGGQTPPGSCRSSRRAGTCLSERPSRPSCGEQYEHYRSPHGAGPWQPPDRHCDREGAATSKNIRRAVPRRRRRSGGALASSTSRR